VTVKKRKIKKLPIPIRPIAALAKGASALILAILIALILRFVAGRGHVVVASRPVAVAVQPNPRPLPSREGEQSHVGVAVLDTQPITGIVKSASVQKKHHVRHGAKFVCAGGHAVGLDRCTQ
jgi:hypothetical protein